MQLKFCLISFDIEPVFIKLFSRFERVSCFLSFDKIISECLPDVVNYFPRRFNSILIIFTRDTFFHKGSSRSLSKIWWFWNAINHLSLILYRVSVQERSRTGGKITVSQSTFDRNLERYATLSPVIAVPLK